MYTNKKTATFRERLTELCIESPYSDTELAAKLKVSKQTLSAWKSGTRSPKENTIIAIAQYFGVTVQWLMGFDVPKKNEALDFALLLDSSGSMYANLEPLPITHRVPLLGTIACGDPITAEENIEGYVDAPVEKKCHFALRCKGDSMINARIMDGDIVFIRQQDTVNDGEIAAVLIDDEATLKRVHFLPQGMLMLQAENPKYPPIYIGGDDETRNVRILGKAVAFQSDIR